MLRRTETRIRWHWHIIPFILLVEVSLDDLDKIDVNDIESVDVIKDTEENKVVYNLLAPRKDGIISIRTKSKVLLKEWLAEQQSLEEKMLREDSKKGRVIIR
ncbi:MAG: hypothetical protein J5676_02370 [Bacteroidaceae bacterium]|nr:hypothetical protein [Bacteroidaceae bacterium]